eukprot:CAMPEP_0170065066 /NCGR_PEP_ID=MMETSP0019_2-20121128/5297_1 /TAXON_ID=98059 /ORGANISM="Dinobryon sp., Strain UTEXLB2267" /LENGTH=289 /DNA_ID=CAMNT_0010271851 /DNA_START=57 /DNA_END=926 /DNA_ORIENTATION=-
MADCKELSNHPSHRYYAVPLEENMFEWHFTIRGPSDTPFEGGMYHGRILLPSEYPFKPPNIVFLTKNGRFETGTKICLSISAYHEESWQPAWGVRTMLEAIISFLPSEGAGAIGALDWTPEERKKLAIESNSYCCPLCGPISSLLTAPPAKSDSDSAEDGPDETILSQISQLQMKKSAQSSSNSNTPSDSTKTHSCSECKESPSGDGSPLLERLKTSLFDEQDTSLSPAPTNTPSTTTFTHPTAQVPLVVEHDTVDTILFALLVMIGGMMLGVVLRIAIKVSQQPQLLL